MLRPVLPEPGVLLFGFRLMPPVERQQTKKKRNCEPDVRIHFPILIKILDCNFEMQRQPSQPKSAEENIKQSKDKKASSTRARISRKHQD
jgi:hypothetical protein